MNQMQPFSLPSDGVKFDQKNGDGGGQGMQQGQMQGNNNQNGEVLRTRSPKQDEQNGKATVGNGKTKGIDSNEAWDETGRRQE